MELIGIPHRIVVSDRGLSEGVLEYKGRRDSESQNPPIGELMSFITENSAAERNDAHRKTPALFAAAPCGGFC